MILSKQVMPYNAIVQAPGQIYRLPKEFFMDEFNRGGSLYQKVLGYTLILPTQTVLGVMCSHDYKIGMQSGGFLLQ